MKTKKGLIILAVPAVALVGFVALLASRSTGELEIRRPASVARDVEARPVAVSTPPSSVTPRQTERAAPSSPDAVIAKALDDARLRTTYRNFRTAVATSNVRAESDLRKALLRDRATAFKIAQDELSRAKNELDRDIARKTLEALGK